jgi:hypothetical protein
MGERGWGWTSSQIRQVRFIEWLVPLSSSAIFVPVKPFYDAQPDQIALTIRVVLDELQELERQSRIYLAAGMGGVESFDALATAQGRLLAEQVQARRADKRLRRVACRDAMTDWLSSQDATSPLRQSARDQMLDDPRYGTWLAEPFSEVDLNEAAAWLCTDSTSSTASQLISAKDRFGLTLPMLALLAPKSSAPILRGTLPHSSRSPRMQSRSTAPRAE